MPLKVTIGRKEKGIYVVYPVGSIDSNTYTVLEKEIENILKQSPSGIVFDMKEVNYISSAGVRIIIKTEKDLKLKGANVMMVNLQPQIKKVFEIINALPAEQIFSSIEEMDKYLANIQRKVKEDGDLI